MTTLVVVSHPDPQSLTQHVARSTADAIRDLGGDVIFRGQIGDRGVAGAAAPIVDPISTLPTLVGTRTNENEVLRVTLAGNVQSVKADKGAAPIRRLR